MRSPSLSNMINISKQMRLKRGGLSIYNQKYIELRNNWIYLWRKSARKRNNKMERANDYNSFWAVWSHRFCGGIKIRMIRLLWMCQNRFTFNTVRSGGVFMAWWWWVLYHYYGNKILQVETNARRKIKIVFQYIRYSRAQICSWCPSKCFHERLIVTRLLL